MSKKTVLITGANRGIGLALTQQFCARSDQVIAVCRRASSDLHETDADIIDSINLTREADLLKLQEQLADKNIDILINNAGLLHDGQLGNVDAGMVRAQFEVNALAPLNVTEFLLDNLDDGSKLVFITSRMGSMADNGSGGYYGYRMSKAALNAAAVSLSHDLADRGIAVGLFHPGFVQTDMVGGNGDISASEAVERLLKRIDELNRDNSGQFLHSNGEQLPW